MKDRPILMSAPMVRATLASTKSQTRRAMARQKKHDFTDYTLFGQQGHPDDEAERLGGWAQPWVAIEHAPDWPDGKEDQCHCPYASQRGDRLWVRETYYAWGHWTKRHSQKKRREEWHFVDETMGAGLVYRYEADEKLPRRKREMHEVAWWKRPAIFMPRAACRITLEVTSVRVERLQDISEADAMAEGIERLPDPVIDGGWSGPNRFTLKGMGAGACAGLVSWNAPTATELYQRLWTEINGPDSWAANPWVWVVEFKRIGAAT